jgi:hypothetical protein
VCFDAAKRRTVIEHSPLAWAAARTPVVDTHRTDRAKVVARERSDILAGFRCVRHKEQGRSLTFLCTEVDTCNAAPALRSVQSTAEREGTELKARVRAWFSYTVAIACCAFGRHEFTVHPRVQNTTAEGTDSCV